MLYYRIKNIYHELSTSEKKIAKRIQDINFKSKSSYAIGKEIGVSQATVIRFSKNLGYNNFEQFQKDLINKDNTHILMQTHDFENIQNIILKNCKNTIDFISRQNNNDEIKKALDYISNANKVLIFGVRNSSSIAKDFSDKLKKYGVNADFNEDIDLQYSLISKLEKCDLVILLSPQGDSDEILNAYNKALKKKVPIISITSFKKNKLYDSSNVVLQTPSEVAESRIDSMVAKMGESIIVDILCAHFINKVLKNT